MVPNCPPLVIGRTRGQPLCLSIAFSFLIAHGVAADQAAVLTAPLGTEVSGQIWAGYQAWFSAGPSDPNGTATWFHLAKDQNRPPAFGSFNVDLWPDMSIYPEASRIDVDAVLPSGQHLQIFSSADERVIQTHLRLMKQFSIGGPFVQRILSDIKD